MQESPTALLWLFAAAFEFGILVFLGAIVSLKQRDRALSSPLPTGQYDAVLLPQLQQAGITDWQRLQQLSGLTAEQVNQFRMGTLNHLSLTELQRLADVLDWGIDDRLEVYCLSTARQENRALRQEGLRLQEALRLQQTTLTETWQRETFIQVQSLLTTYPSIRQMIHVKPDLPAKNLSSLFTNLDNLAQAWGCEAIGSVWSQVAYDPQLHQPDQPDIAAGELVYVRFIGYKLGNVILCPAKVSRTLPASAQP